MVPILLLFIVAFTNVNVADAYLNIQLIHDYIDFKFIKYAHLYTCSAKQSLIKVYETTNNVQSTIPISINTLNVSLFNDDPFGPLRTTIHNFFGIFIDGDCPESTKLVYVMTELAICTTNRPCLISYSNFENNHYKNDFQDLRININADLKVALLSDIKYKIYEIVDIYKVFFRRKTDLVIMKLGTWRPDYKFVFVQNQIGNVFWQRKDWNGTKFITVTVLVHPFNGTVEERVRSEKDMSPDHFNRMGCLFTFYISEFYNFSSMNLNYLNSWGYLLQNGSFDGMVGAFARHEIDFGCAPLFQKYDRLPFVDSGYLVWRLRSVFIFRHPKAKATFEVFFRPLEKYVWFLLLLSMGVIILIMKCITHFEYNRLLNEEIDLSWSAILLFMIGALCQQGSNRIPTFISGRIVTFFVFVFAILVYQYYSASLVSSLLLEPPVTIKNMYDLADSDLKLGSDDVVYARAYFKELANDTKLSKLEKRPLKKTPFFLKPADGLKLVKGGDYAYNVDVATAYPIIQEEFPEKIICKLEEVLSYNDQPLFSSHYKGSPLRKPFNIIYQKIAESGILPRMHSKYNARKPACLRGSVDTSAVGIDEFYPALVILSFGVLISLIILLLECIVHKIKAAYDLSQDNLIYIKPYVN